MRWRTISNIFCSWSLTTRSCLRENQKRSLQEKVINFVILILSNPPTSSLFSFSYNMFYKWKCKSSSGPEKQSCVCRHPRLAGVTPSPSFHIFLHFTFSLPNVSCPCFFYYVEFFSILVHAKLQNNVLNIEKVWKSTFNLIWWGRLKAKLVLYSWFGQQIGSLRFRRLVCIYGSNYPGPLFLLSVDMAGGQWHAPKCSSASPIRSLLSLYTHCS